MKQILQLTVLIMSILSITSSLHIARASSAHSIGSLDINSQEAGDGAGCFFYITENNIDSYVFVDRDGYGWIRINNKIEKFKPVKAFFMWTSKKGDKLNRIYTSGQSQVELSVEVTTGCTQYEDNCAAIYGGTLSLHLNGNETVIKVKGKCGC